VCGRTVLAHFTLVTKSQAINFAREKKKSRADLKR
jgi:hypothetical protein